LYKIGIEQPDFKPVEHAMVDDRIPFGIPKKLSCDEAGSHTFYKVGYFTYTYWTIIVDFIIFMLMGKRHI